jgi:hypothetical protein
MTTQQLMQFTIFDPTDSIQVEDIYLKSEPLLRQYLHKIPVLRPDETADDLIAAGYILCGDKFFQPRHAMEESDYQKLFYKMALLENIKFRNNGDTSTTLLSNFIYVRDKYADIRGLSKDIYSRLDTFVASKEYKKKYNSYTIRHNGTSVGGALYKLQRTGNFKKINREYLKIHQHGPYDTHLDLMCHVRNLPVSGISMTNYATMTLVDIFDNQFHHILYSGATSVYKTDEPSKYFGTMSYKNWPHDVHVEFLGCITLCGDAHDAIHNSNPNWDDINNWFSRLKNKECHSLPYAWNSELNYNRFIDWLDNHTIHFDKNKAPNYHDFIKSQGINHICHVVE